MTNSSTAAAMTAKMNNSDSPLIFAARSEPCFVLLSLQAPPPRMQKWADRVFRRVLLLGESTHILINSLTKSVMEYEGEPCEKEISLTRDVGIRIGKGDRDSGSREKKKLQKIWNARGRWNGEPNRWTRHRWKTLLFHIVAWRFIRPYQQYSSTDLKDLCI